MTPLEKTKTLTDAMGWEFNLASVEKYKARCIKKGWKTRLKYVHQACNIMKADVPKMDKPLTHEPKPEPPKKKARGRPKKS